MEDQRRVFVAIALTLGIFFAWQALVKSTRPQSEVSEAAPAAPVQGPATGTVPSGSAGSPNGAVAMGEVKSAGGAAATPVAVESFASFETPLLSGTLASTGGLSKLVLKHYQEARGEAGALEPISLVTAALGGAERQAIVRIEVGGVAVPLEFVERGPERFVLAGKAGDTKATLVVTPHAQEYALGYELRLENASTASVKASASVAMGLAASATAGSSGFMAPAADMVSGLCAADGAVRRSAAKALEDGPKVYPAANWAGLDRQYFVVAVVPQSDGGECKMSTRNATVLIDYGLGGVDLGAGKSWVQQFSLYLGPKRDSDLKVVAPVLADVIDYNIWKIPLGFLARPMVAILNVFHTWTGSWGVAIMLLTFLVKTLLFPVTYKSVTSMRRMSLVKPEIEKLKERFGNDRERMQLEQVKLFREKGINPLGGCLPMLLQMPVWFALYRMLWTSVDLYQQKFLWLDNLTAKEHFPFLSIAFGLLTVAQQKLTPTTMDSQQAKIMMYVMPVVFAFFMINLPSGLVLYIAVNSILTIIQQLVINRRQVTL